MKSVCFIAVLVIVLVAAYPVQAAGVCDPQAVWISGEGEADPDSIVVVSFDVDLQSLNFLIVDTAYPYNILDRSTTGFTAQVEGYYKYYVFGYVAVPCYYVSLPLVIQ